MSCARLPLCLVLASACQAPAVATVSIPPPLRQAVSADRLQNLHAVFTIKSGEDVVFTRTRRDISGDKFSIGFEGVEPGTYDFCVAFYGDSGSTTDLYLTSVGHDSVTLVGGDENRITGGSDWVPHCVEKDVLVLAELEDVDGDGWSNLDEILRGLDPGSVWTAAHAGVGLRALGGSGSNNIFAISESEIIWMGEQEMKFTDAAFPTQRAAPVPAVVPIAPATGCATPTLLSLAGEQPFGGTTRGGLVGAGDGCVVAIENELDSAPTARLLQPTNTAGTVDYTDAWTSVVASGSKAGLLSSTGDVYAVAESAQAETVVIGDAPVATSVEAHTIIHANTDPVLVTAHAGEVAHRSWPGWPTFSCTFAWPALDPILLTGYRGVGDPTTDPVSVLVVFEDGGRAYLQRLILAQPGTTISQCGAALGSTSLALPHDFGEPTAMLTVDDTAIGGLVYDEANPCACNECCSILLVGDDRGRVITARIEHGVGEPEGPWVELGTLAGGAVVGFADANLDTYATNTVFAATQTTVYRAP